MRTAIVGGGAAGFFLAINLKEMCPQMQVTVFERSGHVLRKVKVSGGGRCNCTNTFEGIKDLSSAYPRGHRLMKRLMKGFNQHDAYEWFEQHGVPLTIQPDHCVFPAAQDSQAIIDCFLYHCRRLGIEICTNSPIASLSALSSIGDFDFIALTYGGQPRAESLQWLADLGHEIEKPVPSLFTFSIQDSALHALMGTVAGPATALIPGTSFHATGPLLITHWGMSGPAILKLSSYAARYLAEHHYQSQLAINWTSYNEEVVRQQLLSLIASYPKRKLSTLRPFDLPARLWLYLLQKADIPEGSTASASSKKNINRMVTLLTYDTYDISGKAPFKDEFVTCGGISLSSINPSTLESRHHPHLFFAGELLDLDGITGGFNFQAAWTTAHTIACAITSQATASA